MIDKEKVIKGLESCTNGEVCFSDCPYFKEMSMTDGRCITILQADALSLLKEQEAKWVHKEDMDFIDKYNCTHFHGMCTNCGFVHDFIDGHTGQYLYCPHCGKAVKWE